MALALLIVGLSASAYFGMRLGWWLIDRAIAKDRQAVS